MERQFSEASDLGWAAGSWPAVVHINNVRYNRVRLSFRESTGDLISVLYRTDNGEELEVFND